MTAATSKNQPLKGILQKILEVQRTIEVEKTGYDDRNEYFYHRAEDVLNAVRDKLNELGVITRTRIERWEQENYYDSNGRGRPRTTIEGVVTYIDVETGEEYDTYAIGTGSDIGGDKGPRKAHTMIKKISLLDTFLIGEGIDKFDADGAPEQEPANMQVQDDTPAGKTVAELTETIGDFVRNTDNAVEGATITAIGKRVAASIPGASADPKEFRKDIRVLIGIVAALEKGELE